MATLDILNLSVRRGEEQVLVDVTITVGDGEMVAIIGGSGSGKTTLLRAVAGLERPDAGEVRIAGVVQESGAASRDVAMVFQESVLYPFMDVASNVGFPLNVRRVPKTEIEARVRAEGRAVGIEKLLHRHPYELSAGYRHLSQVARAMVRRPKLFLMDEPLASLDAGLRLKMRDELKMIQRGYGVTALYVTNDPTEAMSMADRAVVLEGGMVAQDASTDELYHRPVDRGVAELMGELSALTVSVVEDADGFWLAHPGFRIRAWAPALAAHVGSHLEFVVRPEYLQVTDQPDLVVQAERVVYHGAYSVVSGRVAGDGVDVRVSDRTLRPGARLPVRVRRYMLFDPRSGSALHHQLDPGGVGEV